MYPYLNTITIDILIIFLLLKIINKLDNLYINSCREIYLLYGVVLTGLKKVYSYIAVCLQVCLELCLQQVQINPTITGYNIACGRPTLHGKTLQQAFSKCYQESYFLLYMEHLEYTCR